MKLQPTGLRYVIEPYEAATETQSGLIMDNTSNTSAAKIKGTILEVGDGDNGRLCKYKKGDIVYFRRYSIDELKYINESGEDVLCVELSE